MHANLKNLDRAAELQLDIWKLLTSIKNDNDYLQTLVAALSPASSCTIWGIIVLYDPKQILMR